MGMNIISIDIIPKNIEYICSIDTWKYDGNSNISCKDVKKELRKLKFRKLGYNYYTDNRIIDLRIWEKGSELVSIHVEGIIKHIDRVLEMCYSLAEYFSQMYELRFCVLGEYIKFGEYDNFIVSVKKLYKVKIEWCNRGYLRDFEYVIPPHKFDKMYKRYCKKL